MWTCTPSKRTPGLSSRGGDRSGRKAGGEREAELRVVLTGGDVVMGVRLDSGSNPNQDIENKTRLVVHRFDPVEFVEAVDDQTPDLGRGGGA